MNLVTSGGGAVLINGVAPASQGNINAISAQVAANTASIGAGAEPAVVTPSVVAQLGTITTAVGTAQTTANNAQTTANNAQTTANNAQTLANKARIFTLDGTSIAGAITYNQAPNVTINTGSWVTFTTIQLKVPPDWTTGSGLSVSFDGYAYYNYDGNVSSYYTIYYNSPPLNNTFLPLIGNNASGITDAIFSPLGGQAYIPLNLTIPPTNLTPASASPVGGTINIQINGRLLAGGTHQLVSNPLIGARVGLVFP